MQLKTVPCFICSSSSFDGKSEYALRLLFEGIGLKLRIVGSVGEADLVYSSDLLFTSNNKIWLRSSNPNNWDQINPKVFWDQNIPWLGNECYKGSLKGDILFSTYALVTGCFETKDVKDQWGVPIARNSKFHDLGFLERPTISTYCKLLKDLLDELYKSNLKTLPIWPNGKEYAIVLSHDVDAPLSYIDVDFRKKLIARNLHKKEYLEFFKSYLGLAKTIFKKAFGILPSMKNDPNFCFDKWMDFQERLLTKSAFYVAPICSADKYADSRDVNYIYNRKEMIDMMKIIIERGWEIGLHPSINSWKNKNYIHQEKYLLEDALDGYLLAGVRHHYWSMDNEIPERTISIHKEAGFKYDSSLGLNDSPGFRRSIAWPFNPYNKSTNAALDILEIPPTLMDGGIFYRDVSVAAGKKEILEHIDITFKHRGAVVLDWHLEQMNFERLNGAGKALVEALTEVSDDENIFWASPKEIYEWWVERRKKLSPG